VDDGDSGIPKEILLIECEQVHDAVNVHRGDQPGIVHFDTDDGMDDYELAPFGMNLFRIGQEREAGFDEPRTPVRLCRGQAITVLLLWSRANIPEFGQVLGRKA
jgi:hypothetical protein